MADRYQRLTRTPVGTFLVKRLGLPDPTPLARYQAGEQLVSGTVVVGGTGRLRATVVAAATAAGGDVVTAAPEAGPVAGLVFDASGLRSPAQLVTLHEFFSPLLRSLDRCGRVVVLGTTPGSTPGTTPGATPAPGDAGERITQRALEGFTRSLGKELRRGGTCQLVYVEPGAEDRVASTLQFLLSAKSAYVSGQVVRVGTQVTDDAARRSVAPVADQMRPLAGKVALVTGAARGIGAAIAQVLHRDGATVVGLDVPQAASDLQAVTERLDGGWIALDITGIDAPQRIARTLRERHGGVDIVVHNAGITRDKKLANMSPARWNPVIDVNLVAPARLTTELLQQGLIRPNGRVVGVTSVSGIAGNAGQTNYATSKAGVIGLVDVMAPRAASHGVTVNAVAPGFIETQMTAAVPVLLREAGRRLNSLSQGGQPVDVAETVAWYANPDSVGITGNVVRVCGQSLLGA